MTWYYWLYIAFGIVWFLDMYSATVRQTTSNWLGDLVVKPIIIGVLAAVWPLTFVYFMVKAARSKKATTSD